ncbi:tumor necrosis factor ligand superfamily member 10-like [Brienomyrus brachyistius]|uniref:tumor necrosis factor ligand superfamily member 10-like n=1 Tax=Brienomyrus brachyistius TaxID=42636 RepID=UPI0020B1B23E|nr:tumor necrosis factor ligand superfamily member 10-like [Brienomyrus brachyistius]
MALNDSEVYEFTLTENNRREETRRQRCSSRLVIYFLLFVLGGLVALGFLFGSKLFSKRTEVAAEDEAAAARGPESALPNAHLTALSDANVSSIYLPWEHEKGDAYLHLFSYDRQKLALIVPEKGRYSIYLQVTYREPHNLNCPDGGILRFLQAVYVWSDSYTKDRILMRAKDHIHCSRKSGVRTVTSTGVHWLEAGDRLMVFVSQKNLLEIDEKSLYFGAFLLSRGTDV